MRSTLIVALFLTLAVPCVDYSQQPKKPRPKTAAPQSQRPTPSVTSVPPPLTDEKAFFYFIAIYGAPANPIERYGNYFDASNYRRAMADEFERHRYVERIGALIADGVNKINFSDKFTFVGSTTFEGYTMLGEYSFTRNSFPLLNVPYSSLCRNMDHSSGICHGTFLDVAYNARARDAVNGADFNWSVPMSEADANAFVKSRTMAQPGVVNRQVAARITYSITNTKARSSFDGRAVFAPFIYSVEVFSDESLTQKLGVIPKIKSLGPSTAEDWRLATVAAQTATKEIGKYRGSSYCRQPKSDGKIHDPFAPSPPCDRWLRTLTLTDVGVTLLDEQAGVSLETQRINFFDSPTTILWRGNDSAYSDPTQEIYSVVWQKQSGARPYVSFRFDSKQERDRFFADLTQALQEWKTKYARFQFAGQVKVYQQCEINSSGRFVTCSETTLSSEGKPVWQTPTYKVTVESLERNANNYIATLEFENLTDKTIKIAWQEKSGLVPDATGPYLIDESGEKYFAKGTDSGNILQDTMKYLWVALPEILPQSKLKSRFVFSGNGDGKMFTLKAKEMLQDLGDRLVTIDGLKVTAPSEVIDPPATSGSSSSSGATVTAPIAATSKTDDIYALGATQGTSVKSAQLVFVGKEDFESGGRGFTRYKFSVSNRSDFPDAMFEPAPDLPPCGRNANASRSWVDLFTRDGRRLNGFCALGSSDGLKQLWFALAQEEAPPDLVYIVINDRKLNRQVKSNLVSTGAR